jgi:hypothetical protein
MAFLAGAPATRIEKVKRTGRFFVLKGLGHEMNWNIVYRYW